MYFYKIYSVQSQKILNCESKGVNSYILNLLSIFKRSCWHICMHISTNGALCDSFTSGSWSEKESDLLSVWHNSSNRSGLRGLWVKSVTHSQSHGKLNLNYSLSAGITFPIRSNELSFWALQWKATPVVRAHKSWPFLCLHCRRKRCSCQSVVFQISAMIDPEVWTVAPAYSD